ncbi:universal stress protein [Streptomyces sp. NBC_01476]|uniref:universal stress protein n=1 Tax=Streptomyces sp. NBC_01476 TaxID=2903881 RepID=UPI002E2F4C29|nr:universal stress protein [Streptomyces sp. NBC_01476]
MSENTAERPIIVGVNGSPASLAALHWAATQAQLLHVPVVTVQTWEPSVRLRAPYATEAPRRTPAEDRVQAQQRLRRAVTEVRVAHPDADVRAELVEGAPVVVLLRYARRARLLALGHGLHDNGLPTELGPVARDCLREARCPVVTIPPAADREPHDGPPRPGAQP